MEAWLLQDRKGPEPTYVNQAVSRILYTLSGGEHLMISRSDKFTRTFCETTMTQHYGGTTLL